MSCQWRRIHRLIRKLTPRHHVRITVHRAILTSFIQSRKQKLLLLERQKTVPDSHPCLPAPSKVALQIQSTQWEIPALGGPKRAPTHPTPLQIPLSHPQEPAQAIRKPSDRTFWQMSKILRTSQSSVVTSHTSYLFTKHCKCG